MYLSVRKNGTRFWRDGSVSQVLIVQVQRHEELTFIPSNCVFLEGKLGTVCTSVIPTRKRQRQVNPWDLLARQYSWNCKLWAPKINKDMKDG